MKASLQETLLERVSDPLGTVRFRRSTGAAMGIPPLAGQFLPVGRHQGDLDEVEAAFVGAPVFAKSRSRRALWDDLVAGLVTLETVITVYQLWIGGSFVTSKLDPGDLDVTFVIDGRGHFALQAADMQVVESFLPLEDANGVPTRSHGLALDSFVLDWWPWEPKLDLPDQPWGKGKSNQYLKMRGYWDDWWQRARTKPKGAPSELEDALPRSGYLEVNLRDFAI